MKAATKFPLGKYHYKVDWDLDIVPHHDDQNIMKYLYKNECVPGEQG